MSFLVFPINVPRRLPERGALLKLEPDIVGPVAGRLQRPRFRILIINDIYTDSVPVSEAAVVCPRLTDLRDASGKFEWDFHCIRAIRDVAEWFTGTARGDKHQGGKSATYRSNSHIVHISK